MYQPPFTVTPKIIDLISRISEKIGEINSLESDRQHINLRKENRIMTIHSSLAIENNSLSIEQITAIIEGKRVLGAPNEIQEVKNALQAYELLLSIDSTSEKDLLYAHKLMMQDLVTGNGKYRKDGVGIFDGAEVVHVAPPAERVLVLMSDLFDWLKNAEVHPLIKSCVFHYEFVFIHPFADGNGRMARLWHTAILSKWKPVFEYIPIESQNEKFQEEYYDAIARCHVDGASTIFIEFMLSQIDSILDDISVQIREDNQQLSEYIKKLLDVMEYDVPYTSKMLMEKLGLKSKEGFRRNYLRPAIDLNLIRMTIPDKPNSRNQRYVKI